MRRNNNSKTGKRTLLVNEILKSSSAPQEKAKVQEMKKVKLVEPPKPVVRKEEVDSEQSRRNEIKLRAEVEKWVILSLHYDLFKFQYPFTMGNLLELFVFQKKNHDFETLNEIVEAEQK